MKQRSITLFSSDSSDLYKADVFRVLALPNGYTLQFRYARQWVLEEFREKPEQLKNQQAVIFFLAGNDLSKPPAERNLRLYPIRSCRIVEARLDENTDLIILILRLSDFVNCAVDPTADIRKMPPLTFVSEADLNDFRTAGWIDRVKAIEADFQHVLFYRIAKILHGHQEIAPSYSADRRLSFFELEEESDYSIECSCYDRSRGRYPLQIRFASEEIDLRNFFESGTRAGLDTQRLPLTTRTLKSRSAPAFSLFTRLSTRMIPDPLRTRITSKLRGP